MRDDLSGAGKVGGRWPCLRRMIQYKRRAEQSLPILLHLDLGHSRFEILESQRRLLSNRCSKRLPCMVCFNPAREAQAADAFPASRSRRTALPAQLQAGLRKWRKDRRAGPAGMRSAYPHRAVAACVFPLGRRSAAAEHPKAAPRTSQVPLKCLRLRSAPRQGPTPESLAPGKAAGFEAVRAQAVQDGLDGSHLRHGTVAHWVPVRTGWQAVLMQHQMRNLCRLQLKRRATQPERVRYHRAQRLNGMVRPVARGTGR